MSRPRKPKDPVRVAEGRDRNTRYYALHPGRIKRGTAMDLVDASGRGYRIVDDRSMRVGGFSRDTVGLIVKEKKGEQALDRVSRVGAALPLYTAPDAPEPRVIVTIAGFGLREPQRRTWRIDVRGLDAQTIAELMAARV